MTGDKHKFDGGKLRLSLVPVEALRAVTEVLEFGAKKYCKEGWKKVPNAEERYLDALYRHTMAIHEHGVTAIDEDSKLLHAAHVMCNAAFLVWFALGGDDG